MLISLVDTTGLGRIDYFLRFRKSLLHVIGLQLLIGFYFIPQLSGIERHDGERNNEFVLHGFEIFCFSVASGNFINTGFVRDFIMRKVLSTDI